MQEWTHETNTFDTGCLAEFGEAIVGTGTTSGLAEGCKVAVEGGWRLVEDLRPGDRVMTFDEGLQEVKAVERQCLWTGMSDCPEALWPVFLPAGLIGNDRELMVLPDQAVRLPEDNCDDPDLLVPAQALAGLPGVERVPPFATVEVVRPIFDCDQLVVTDGEALLYCPADWSPLYSALREDEPDYRIAGLGMAFQVVELAMNTSLFTDPPITFPANLVPGAPINQDNYPVQTKIA